MDNVRGKAAALAVAVALAVGGLTAAPQGAFALDNDNPNTTSGQDGTPTTTSSSEIRSWHWYNDAFVATGNPAYLAERNRIGDSLQGQGYRLRYDSNHNPHWDYNCC